MSVDDQPQIIMAGCVLHTDSIHHKQSFSPATMIWLPYPLSLVVHGMHPTAIGLRAAPATMSLRNEIADSDQRPAQWMRRPNLQIQRGYKLRMDRMFAFRLMPEKKRFCNSRKKVGNTFPGRRSSRLFAGAQKNECRRPGFLMRVSMTNIPNPCWVSLRSTHSYLFFGVGFGIETIAGSLY
jgi:hypothetical protein